MDLQLTQRWLAGLVALSSALVLALSSAARAETRPIYGGKIIGGLLSEPVEFDPTRARSHAEVTLVSLIFDTLYQVGGTDAKGRIKLTPHLAAAQPQVSANGLEVRIPLRDGVVFHDGSSVTAKDVALSLKRVTKSDAAWLLAPVRDIRAEAGVVIVDLRRKTPKLGLLLTAPATSVTPRGKPPRSRNVIGSGPFQLRRIERKKRQITLVAANRHFAGRPYVNKLELRWFERGDDEATDYEAGKSQLSLRGSVAFSGHEPKYRTGEVMGPTTLLIYVGFGGTSAHRAITDNPDFRRALSLAIGRNGFRGVGTGEHVAPTVHPNSVALDGPSTPERARQSRMKEARQALSRASQKVAILRESASRSRLALELIVDQTRPDDREIAEKVVAGLFRLGITARTTSVSASEFVRRVRRDDCDLYIGQLTAPAPVADLALAAAFAAGGDRWAQSRLAKGALGIKRASRAFDTRLPVIPLFHRALRVHHQSNVRGLRFDNTSQLALDDAFYFGRKQTK